MQPNLNYLQEERQRTLSDRIHFDEIKEKTFNHYGTQTINIDEKDSIIDDEMEIIPSNEIHEDFVQLDFNENEQIKGFCFFHFYLKKKQNKSFLI